eukprot:7378592-Prymnesium_polylepis.1
MEPPSPVAATAASQTHDGAQIVPQYTRTDGDRRERAADQCTGKAVGNNVGACHVEPRERRRRLQPRQPEAHRCGRETIGLAVGGANVCDGDTPCRVGVQARCTRRWALVHDTVKALTIGGRERRAELAELDLAAQLREFAKQDFEELLAQLRLEHLVLGAAVLDTGVRPCVPAFPASAVSDHLARRLPREALGPGGLLCGRERKEHGGEGLVIWIGGVGFAVLIVRWTWRDPQIGGGQLQLVLVAAERDREGEVRGALHKRRVVAQRSQRALDQVLRVFWHEALKRVDKARRRDHADSTGI